MTDRQRKVVIASVAVVLLGITAALTLREPGASRPRSEPGAAAQRGNYPHGVRRPRWNQRSRAAHRVARPYPRRRGRRVRRPQPHGASVRRTTPRHRAARRSRSDGRGPRVPRWLPAVQLRPVRRGADPSCGLAAVARAGGITAASAGDGRSGASPADLGARGGGDRRSRHRRAGGGRRRPAAIQHPARGAPRRPPLDRDGGQWLTRVSVVVQPRIARRLIAAGAAAIALLGLLLVLLVATLMGGLAPPSAPPALLPPARAV